MSELLTGNTPEKWEQIKTHPFYEPMRKELLARAEKHLSTPVPPVPYSAYIRFLEDGNRSEYEAHYFARRHRLSELTVLARLYGEKYLQALSDVLWAIMDEATWALPAHIKEGFDDPYERLTFLELGSTETGSKLAECDMILGDMIPARIRARMASTVRERIIEPFFQHLYWWYKGSNNWGSVCCANVMLCIAHYGTEEQFFRAEPTMHETVTKFLASYGEDCCCLEGVSYWYYGFGHFVRYADTVRNYTRLHPSTPVAHTRLSIPDRSAKLHGERPFVKDGVIDYFARDDVRRSALFAANMRLMGECSVSFSDGPSCYSFRPDLLSYLKNEYPDDIFYPELSLADIQYGDVRSFLWSDPDGVYGDRMKTGTVYYKEGQWFIRNGERYSFAAKGGYNEESHNHNDVGSFLITTKNGMALVDLGAGEYTRQYFQNEHRYGLLVCSSRGHSVPIVNGALQKRGNVRALVETDGKDNFSVEFAPVYEEPSLKRLSRRFSCDEGGVTLSDTFVFSEMPKSLTERFVSWTEPVLAEGEIRVGDVRLCYDSALFTAAVSSEDYAPKAETLKTAYLIDLVPKALTKEAVYTFRFVMDE